MTRIRRIARGATLAGGVVMAALAGYLGWLHTSGNFHAVVAGEVYRAAQVRSADIAAHQADQGIRSILNLRGASPGAAWYDDELASSTALSISHVDFALSASVEVSPVEAARRIALMKAMPKPLLIRCRHGSDRTGLASALYLAAISGKTEAEAEAQLSLRFAHFAVPYLSDADPMDQTWERMEPILGYVES